MKRLCILFIAVCILFTNNTTVYAVENEVVEETINPEAINFTKDQIDLTNMVNEIRVSNGLNQLKLNKELCDLAEIRVKESTVKWSHTRPDGTPYYTVNDELVYGENLSRQKDRKNYVSKTMTGWVNSPSHYEIINWTEAYETSIGFAIYETDTYVYVCMLID